MDLIDKIRAEVERRRSEYEDRLRFSDWYGGTEDRIKMGECKQILSFIDSLPEEPAPKGYDESYLNECIAKASKTWKGVDVEKYMDEVRGDRPKLSDSLEEAAERQINEALFKWSYDDEDGIEQYVHDAFIAGAKWRYQKDRAEFAKLKAKEWSDGYNEGITKGKEQMMKEAVEGEIENASFGIVYLRKNLANEGHLTGDKVRIIIVKEDER